MNNNLQITSAEFEGICDLVRSSAGITLGGSKRALVVSRLSKRLRHHGYTTFAQYLVHLHEHDVGGAEMLEMINCITTNKTEFFREPHHFEWIREHLVPMLRQRAKASGRRSVRIWSAGCSTGQEPYSIAMVLADGLAEPGWDIKILASDIDTNVLAHARAGEYDVELVHDVPEALRRKYFEPSDGGYRVVSRLRSLVTFGRINFIEPKWPIKTRFDVIFCRNVTIYFDRETQETVYARFERQLEPGGYLVAGHSENLHWLSQTFAPIGKTIYQRTEGRRPSVPAAMRRRSSRVPAPPETAIQSGELHVSAAPALVRTTLGSCVAACIYDPEAQVGGMNHFMLPDGCETDGVPTRFGTHAMGALVERLLALGADRRRLRAKIFGGAHVLRGMSEARSIPDNNVAFVRTFLADAGVPVQAEKVGGELPMLVRFQTHTGRAFVRTVEGSDTETVIEREIRYRDAINGQARESESAMPVARKIA